MEDYSVWAVPPEDVRTRTKNLMSALRLEFGGPEFEPHMTVVRAIRLWPEDAVTKFRRACMGVKAYTVNAIGVHGSRGLLFDPTPQVVATSDHCCGHFGYVRPTAYVPHMSLLYTDLTEEQIQKAQEKAIALDESFGSLIFDINRLALYRTDTEDTTLESWEKVVECELEAA